MVWEAFREVSRERFIDWDMFVIVWGGGEGERGKIC